MESQDDELPYYGGYWHITAFNPGQEINFLFRAIPGTQAYEDLLAQVQDACRAEGIDLEQEYEIQIGRISRSEIKEIWSA